MADSTWLAIWHNRLEPGLSDEGLERLRQGLASGDQSAWFYCSWWQQPRQQMELLTLLQEVEGAIKRRKETGRERA